MVTCSFASHRRPCLAFCRRAATRGTLLLRSIRQGCRVRPGTLAGPAVRPHELDFQVSVRGPRVEIPGFGVLIAVAEPVTSSIIRSRGLLVSPVRLFLLDSQRVWTFSTGHE